jgi:hypothetical protein
VWDNEIRSFARPAGRFFSAHGLLFSSSETGLEIWDPTDGTLLGAIAGFSPTHHHPHADELVAVRGSELRRWRISPALG